jgi:hypothetical protein
VAISACLQTGFSIDGSANMGNISGPLVGVGAYGTLDMVMVPRVVGDTSPTAASKVLRGPYASLLEFGINSPDLDPYNIIAVGESRQDLVACRGTHGTMHVELRGPPGSCSAVSPAEECGRICVWQVPSTTVHQQGGGMCVQEAGHSSHHQASSHPCTLDCPCRPIHQSHRGLCVGHYDLRPATHLDRPGLPQWRACGRGQHNGG